MFDSYAYVRRLRDAGMDEQQAAIQAEIFMALAEDRFATKQDIAELKRDIAELKWDIETTKAELRKDIALARVTTIQWTAGMFAAQTALILGALFAVMKMNHSPAYHAPAQEMRQPAPAPLLPVPPLPPSAPTR